MHVCVLLRFVRVSHKIVLCSWHFKVSCVLLVQFGSFVVVVCWQGSTRVFVMVSPPYCRWCCSGELELCTLTELQTVTHAKVGALRRPPYPETPAPWWRKQPPDDPSDKTSYHGPRLVRPPRVLRRVDAVNPEFEVKRFLKVLARLEHWLNGGGWRPRSIRYNQTLSVLAARRGPLRPRVANKRGQKRRSGVRKKRLGF